MTEIDDIYVYLVCLPEGIDEMVTPSGWGYTIYIDERLDRLHRIRAYAHALEHIKGNDFERSDVQEIESDARHHKTNLEEEKK